MDGCVPKSFIRQSIDPRSSFCDDPTPSRLLAELRESVSMALNALTAHKLRSALTLLGVLIGVFSIIVVMTAMRVLERNIETELSQLGSQTFAIQKWPEVQFGNRSDWEKYWRRKDITLEQGQTGGGKSHARRRRRHRRQFLGRTDLRPATPKPRPPSSCSAKPPAVSRRTTGTIEDGRVLTDNDVDDARDVCVLGSALAKTVFPFGSAVGEEIKINGIQLRGRRRARAQGRLRWAATRTILPSSRSPPRSTAMAAGGTA